MLSNFEKTEKNMEYLLMTDGGTKFGFGATT